MFWPQGNQREHPFMGRAAMGWWRPAGPGRFPTLYGRAGVGQQAPSGATSIFVEPAVYGIPIVPVLIALGLVTILYAATRNG